MQDYSKNSAANVRLTLICIQAKWPIRLPLISGFCIMKQLGVFLLCSGGDAQVHHRVTPSKKNCHYSFIHLDGESTSDSVRVKCSRVIFLPKNATQCHQLGLTPQAARTT